MYHSIIAYYWVCNKKIKFSLFIFSITARLYIYMLKNDIDTDLLLLRYFYHYQGSKLKKILSRLFGDY